jgi:hypothetical protein
MKTDKSDCIYIQSCVQRVHGKSLSDPMKCKKNCGDYEPTHTEEDCSCDVTFFGETPMVMNECDSCKNKRENE